jgi:hypothetical protein
MSSGTALNRGLQQLNPEILRQEYRELTYYDGRVIPTMTNLQVSAGSVYNITFTEQGKADFFSVGSKSMPLVDANADLDEYQIHGVWSGYKEDFFTKLKQGNNRDVNYADTIRQLQFAADRAIAEKLNTYAAYGESKLNVTGFINNASVTVDNTSDNLESLTQQQLYNYFVDLKYDVYSGSNFTQQVNALELPPTKHSLILKARSEENPISVKSRLLNDGIFTYIGESPELLFDRLEANGVLSGGTNKDRIIVYKKDPKVVKRQVETQRVKMIPQEWLAPLNLNKIYGMYSCATETQILDTTCIRYVNVAKTA